MPSAIRAHLIFYVFIFIFFNSKKCENSTICANCQMRDRESIRDLKREKEKHDFTDSGREFHDLIAEGKNELRSYVVKMANAYWFVRSRRGKR